jgi:hypothetical protein
MSLGMKIVLSIGAYVALVLVLGLVIATTAHPEPVEQEGGDED